jgi:hypothetical protein
MLDAVNAGGCDRKGAEAPIRLEENGKSGPSAVTDDLLCLIVVARGIYL